MGLAHHLIAIGLENPRRRLGVPPIIVPAYTGVLTILFVLLSFRVIR
jgi:hypothetical protein